MKTMTSKNWIALLGLSLVAMTATVGVSALRPANNAGRQTGIQSHSIRTVVDGSESNGGKGGGKPGSSSHRSA